MKNLLQLSIFLFSIGVSAQNPDRLNEIQACYETTNPIIKVEVWDAGVEDNDTISLILNGKTVLDSLRLSKEKQAFEFTLSPGNNELNLYALNLGDIPNNTAAILINGEQRVSLNSGLKVNGSLQILLKGDAIFSTLNCPKELKKPDDEEAGMIRANPYLALPSYQLLQQGIRLNANESYRKIDVQDCYTSSTDQVELVIWDCGVEDNDTISLYLNGEWILSNFRLTKAPYIFPVSLKRGENILVLYAHNLGDIPNNTAALSVKNRYSTQEVGMMISDQNTSGAIRISYGLQDEFGHQIPPCLEENKVDSLSEPEIIYLRNKQGKTPPTGNPNQSAPQPEPPTTRPGQVIVVPPPVVVPPRQPRRRQPTPPVTRPRPQSPQPVPPSTTPRTPEKPKPAH